MQCKGAIEYAVLKFWIALPRAQPVLSLPAALRRGIVGLQYEAPLAQPAMPDSRLWVRIRGRTVFLTANRSAKRGLWPFDNLERVVFGRGAAALRLIVLWMYHRSGGAIILWHGELTNKA